MLFTGSCQAVSATRVSYAGSEWNAIIQDAVEGDKLKTNRFYRVVGRSNISLLVERQPYLDKHMSKLA